MNLHITKSKNAESFYIAKSYAKANGSTSSVIVRKLGTLNQLLVEHGPTRDDVLAWAKNEVKLETEKYKKEKEAKTVLIPFHADRQLDYDRQQFFPRRISFSPVRLLRAPAEQNMPQIKGKT